MATLDPTKARRMTASELAAWGENEIVYLRRVSDADQVAVCGASGQPLAMLPNNATLNIQLARFGLQSLWVH